MSKPGDPMLSDAEVLQQVRTFHEEWGNTDGDSLDQLALWEDLATILYGDTMRLTERLLEGGR